MGSEKAAMLTDLMGAGRQMSTSMSVCICVYVVVCVCVWIRLTVIKQNEKDESSVSVCVLFLCTFVCTPAISHPASSQSGPSVFVCLYRFAPSVFNPQTDPCLSWTGGGPLAFWRKCHSRHQWNRYFASDRRCRGCRTHSVETAGRCKVIRLVCNSAVQSTDICCLFQN